MWEKKHRKKQGSNADGKQHKVWDLGGLQQMKTHDQGIMNFFNPGSLMQENLYL
jgi:hypothetical protein